jgi:putative transcription factor
MKTGPNKVEIDGAIMIVCNNCAKMGKPLGGPLVRDSRPTSIQATFRSAATTLSTATPEFEVDPEYNVKIKQAREKLGLSQEDLGRMLNEKPSVIRMVETKKLKPDMVLTRKFMHHLKMNLLIPMSELEGPSGI